MNQGPETPEVGTLEGVDATEQVVEQTETEPGTQENLPENTIEKPSEIEITKTINEINRIDREFFDAQKSAAETQAKISELEEKMGIPSNGGKSPAIEAQNERIKRLGELKNELDQKKEEWITQYGRENLPDGIALDDNEGNREAKGLTLEDKPNSELSEQEKKEDAELRKQLIKAWQSDSVKHFEEAMWGDWKSENVINLEFAIQLMKQRVPEAIEAEAKDFLSGLVEEPSFSTIWIKWKVSSRPEETLGKSGWISNLDITFDDEIQEIANESDIKNGEKEESGVDSKAA